MCKSILNTLRIKDKNLNFSLKRRTKNAKAFHDKCENAYLGCWVWG
ncbi:hypothetical protein ACTMNS_13685 [Staphylococcus haemolyticus]